MKHYTKYFLIFISGFIFFSSEISPNINGRLAGALIKARKTNFFENTVLNGYIDAPKSMQNKKKWSNVANFKFNQRAYKNSLDLPENINYVHYKSAVRIHFYILTCIEDFIYNVFGIVENWTKFYTGLYSTFNVFVLFLFVVWIYKEFGIPISFISAILFIWASPVFVFSDFSFWWLHALPFIFSLHYLRLRKNTEVLFELNRKVLFLVFFIFLSTLTNYEMMPTIMSSCLLPILYYYIKDNVKRKEAIRSILLLGIFIFLGFLLGFVFHFYAVVSYEGSVSLAVEHFNHRFFMRTYEFNSEISSKLNQTLLDGIKKPLYVVMQEFISKGKGIFGIKEYKYLLLFIVLFFYVIKHSADRKLIALFWVVLCSFFTAIFRVVIFKSHGAQSAHQEFVTDSFNISFDLMTILLLSFLIIYGISNFTKFKFTSSNLIE